MHAWNVMQNAAFFLLIKGEITNNLKIQNGIKGENDHRFKIKSNEQKIKEISWRRAQNPHQWI